MNKKDGLKILVTGANGFIGKNLVAVLSARRPDCAVLSVDIDSPPDDLASGLAAADFVFHLAGINRPKSESEFESGNVGLTARICELLKTSGRAVPIVFSSSAQTEQENPYGLSKRKAEGVLKTYAETMHAPVIIYRLKNVFGKWCRPNYNSVVATFCHNIAHDLPITISDLNKEIKLIYIDDIVGCFLDNLETTLTSGVRYAEVEPFYTINLGSLAEQIRAFRQIRVNLYVPDFSNEFTRKLYGTYLSYLAPENLAYELEQKRDARGCLAEFVKSHPFGQIYVSRTHPGVTRGNHYHHTKTEKFLVLEGEAMIRFRHVLGGDVVEYRVRGEDMKVLDIPTGYTHSIENVGAGELVTLFWSPEVFNPARLDTNPMDVMPDK